LRLRAPIPLLNRITAQDTTLGGYFLPKGTVLGMHYNGSLIDPKIWKNPLEFNPDRFEEEAQYNYPFVPFSVGPRNCIGQKFAQNEAILFCAIIAQNFDVKLCNDRVDAVFEGTMTPKGLKCQFIERKQ